MNKDKFLSAKEMFPQLADTSNPNRFIEFIKTPDLRIFCEKCIEKANKTITLYNNDVAEFVLDLMIRKELLTPSNHQTYVDALLIAAHLFDTYYNPANREEVCELFRARQEFETEEGKEILKSLGIEGEYEGIGHCILGYVDGEYPSVPARKPNRVYYAD